METTEVDIEPDREAAPPGNAAGGRFRRLYAWIVREAETPAGAAGMVGLSFVGSGIVPFLLEPPLIVLTTGLPRLWRRFALLFSLGSILGGVLTYVIGYAFIETIGQTVIHFWHAERSWNDMIATVQGRWGFALVAYIALGPGPYKLVTMAAGAAEMSFPAFLAILVLGRSARFLIVAWLARLFGERVRGWFETRPGVTTYVIASIVIAVVTLVYVIVRLVRM
jgi:membrane protein YqaA with SNARE-associated domain